jgi:Uma2 family endonuclease
MSEIQAKVRDYIDAGTSLVWVVDPESRTAMTYGSRGEIGWVTEDGEIEGGDVLPGFRLKVSELFAD